MAESVGSRSMDKKLIQIDISSDTVCPWCFVGKKNLDKAISASQDQYHFEVLLSIFCCLMHQIFVELRYIHCSIHLKKGLLSYERWKP